MTGTEQDGDEAASVVIPEGFYRPGKEDLPDWYVASGYLWADHDHRAGEGRPAYRVVFKTLRVVAIGEARLEWENLSVRIWHGAVSRGRLQTGDALPWRRARHRVVPEWGDVVGEGNALSWQPRGKPVVDFQFDSDELGGGSFVELILETEADEPRARLMEGRSKLASLKTMLDLSFDQRLLGAQITEEVGEVFPDGHFICSAQSETVGIEAQLALKVLEAEGIGAWANTVLDAHMSRPASERRRVGLACQWYQLAGETGDIVLEYLYLWLCVEILAMPDTSNIRSVRETLSSELGGRADDWKRLMERLYQRRNMIVHDGKREVSEGDMADLRDLVEFLLEDELGWVRRERRDRLYASAGRVKADDAT